MLRRIARPMSFLLIFSFLLLDLSAHNARAALVTTESAVQAVRQQGDRARAAAFLGRDEIRQAMVGQGIDPKEAAARLDTLSDAEVSRIAEVLDQLPAGGDGIGAVVGAAVLIFIVLLITDILGLTHVFSFVNR